MVLIQIIIFDRFGQLAKYPILGHIVYFLITVYIKDFEDCEIFKKIWGKGMWF